jgi:hypothetical protein
VPPLELQLPEDDVTSTQTIVLSETLPERPVTVTWYAPVVVVDVVAAVSVAVSADVPLIVTEVGERLHVVGLDALEGAVVIAQLSVTVPVNEFDGVTEMVDVLPVVPPGLTVMLPLLARVKLVLPLPLGACQKSPHPARNPTREPITTGIATTAGRRAHLPIIIAAPCPVLGSVLV